MLNDENETQFNPELSKPIEKLKLENYNVEFQLTNDIFQVIHLFEYFMKTFGELFIPSGLFCFKGNFFSQLWQIFLIPMTLANDDSLFLWELTDRNFRWSKPPKLILVSIIMIYTLKILLHQLYLIINLVLKLLNQLYKTSKEKDVESKKIFPTKNSTPILRGGYFLGGQENENQEESLRLLVADLENAIERLQEFLLDPVFILVKMQKLIFLYKNYSKNECSSYNSYKSKSKLNQSIQRTCINMILKNEKEKVSLKETFLIGY